MDRKTTVFAWLALIFGVLCLFMTAVWAGFILPNAAVSEYSKLAVYVLWTALILLIIGSVTAVLSLVFGILALKSANGSGGRCRAFSIVGIVCGVLLILSNAFFLILV